MWSGMSWSLPWHTTTNEGGQINLAQNDCPENLAGDSVVVAVALLMYT